MFSFLTGLHNTDHCYDDTDNRNYNTGNPNHRFYHLMYLSLNFPSVSPPIYWKFSKCSHFGERRTAYRFGSTHVYYRVFPAIFLHFSAEQASKIHYGQIGYFHKIKFCAFLPRAFYCVKIPGYPLRTQSVPHTYQHKPLLLMSGSPC